MEGCSQNVCESLRFFREGGLVGGGGVDGVADKGL